MSEAGYDEDNVPVGMAEGPPEEAAEGDDSGKISQAQARYRRGSPVQHCGVCMHFVKGADGNTGACTQVSGVISPYGLSNRYAESKNPFGPMLGPQERGMIDEMSQSGPDQSRFAQGPTPAGNAPVAQPAVPDETATQSPAGQPQSPPWGKQRLNIGRQAY